MCLDCLCQYPPESPSPDLEAHVLLDILAHVMLVGWRSFCHNKEPQQVSFLHKGSVFFCILGLMHLQSPGIRAHCRYSGFTWRLPSSAGWESSRGRVLSYKSPFRSDSVACPMCLLCGQGWSKDSLPHARQQKRQEGRGDGHVGVPLPSDPVGVDQAHHSTLLPTPDLLLLRDWSHSPVLQQPSIECLLRVAPAAAGLLQFFFTPTE